MGSIVAIGPLKQHQRRYRTIVLDPRTAVAMRLLVVVLAAIAAFFVSVRARAEGQTGPQPAIVNSTSEAKSGTLLIRREDGRYSEMVRVGTDVDITVSGPTIRARVTQAFQNPTNSWVEAIYVYPLPHGGAVDTLKMVIGDRIVVGEIKERQEARVLYDRAKQNGQKAALTEQERPNIFTNSVANIGPGETVLLQIEYQEPVQQSGETFSLRVPLVVGPRYNPKPLVQSVDMRSDGWGQVIDKDPVPDRDRIEPPVLDPREFAPTNPVSIKVALHAGFPLGEVKSHHHVVEFEAQGDDTRLIKLSGGPVPADRDFELTWQAAPSKTPSVGLFREKVAGGDYLLAYVTPPAVDQAEQAPLPREVILVIDNSGSMGGTSIVQAKASLLFALGRLKPTDRFNVIRFDDTMTVLFPDTVPADGENLAKAKTYVESLQANGGTEMIPPMRAALNDQRNDTNFLRQVVFITDGMIGNEQQLFDTISAMRGRSRVFMVGIGSAPNSFLMTRAAELGRGTFTHIGSVEQVSDRMRGLFEKLESPVVTGLMVEFSNAKADATPAIVPDIYRGEPLLLAAKLDKLDGDLVIKGKVGDRPWTVTLPVAKAVEGKGLSKVWARRKIADAEVARTVRQISPQEADKRILALGLEHQLVTRLTSLVAIDKTPSRPAGEHLKVAELPLNLPAGWEFDKVFGPRPGAKPMLRDANNAPQLQKDGAATTAGSRQFAQVGTGMTLPKTATDAELRMMIGTLLLLLSLILAFPSRLWRFAR
jgi:Ca-activated chloride channel family protein